MGGKLRIVFLVILAGVFFFPPDGVDSLKCVCESMAPGGTVEKCGAKVNGQRPPPLRKDPIGETDCPDGVCGKFHVTNPDKGSEQDLVVRNCFTPSGPGEAVPHLGCETTKTVVKYTTPENKTMTTSSTCFCNDKDFCNSVGQLRGMSWTQLFVSVIFLGVILFRIGGIQ